jgi:hypothetical protein
MLIAKTQMKQQEVTERISFFSLRVKTPNASLLVTVTEISLPAYDSKPRVKISIHAALRKSRAYH